jgi:hypothetical protein
VRDCDIPSSAICATAVIGFNYASCANPIASGELTLTAPAPSGPWPITITVPGLTVFDATLPDGDILDKASLREANVNTTSTPRPEWP